ncbi:MAG: hypothetical protein ACLT98_14200, partial [Eggerthellaceae bacterium]
DLDGCIALFESLKPDRTAANIDLMLASMYQQRGDLDAGLKLFQESMGWCVMNAISCVSAQIPLYADDAEHLEALLRAGEGVLSGFDLQNQSPMTVLTFCTNASSACLQAGDEDRAATYLERFTSLLEELDARMLVYGRNQSALYDQAPELWASIPARSISRKPGSARSTGRRARNGGSAASGPNVPAIRVQAAVRPTGGYERSGRAVCGGLGYRYGKCSPARRFRCGRASRVSHRAERGG